jgi:hypothetical protein
MGSNGMWGENTTGRNMHPPSSISVTIGTQKATRQDGLASSQLRALRMGLLHRDVGVGVSSKKEKNLDG